MTNSPDELEAFFEKVRAEHSALGVKKGTQMLNDTELGEVWDKWAHAVLAVKEGKNPIQIEQRLAQLTTASLYLHEYMRREESKTATYKLAEARKKRENTLTPRRIGG
jgi:hypothetical protein